MSILIELKQCEPWPAQSLGARLMNSDEGHSSGGGGGGSGEVRSEKTRERHRLVNDGE